MRKSRFCRLLKFSATICAAATGASAQPAEESFAEAFARALAEASRDPCVNSDGVRMDRCPEPSETVLPNPALGDYLETLPPDASAAPPSPATVTVKSVSSDSIYRDDVEGSITAGTGGVEQPFQDEARLLIMFRPNIAPQDAAQALADNGLKVVRSLPAIGAVSVDAREALVKFGYASQGGGATTLENLSKSPINRLARRLRRDGRFAAVTVDAVLTGAQISTVIAPKPPQRPPVPNIAAGGSAAAATEREDWGITASNIHLVWPMMTQPVTVGVLDAGFAAHEDLPMQAGSSIAWKKSDHGNHVAGIMCAVHDNGVGIKGVLPNCMVKAAIATIQVPDAATTGDAGVAVEDEIGFLTTLLAEYVGAVLDFMEENPDAKVLNLSLGYNWMPNFGIDPRAKKMKRVRKEVENQGIFIRAILAYAKRRDVAIFSAAGNDSTDLATPLPSKWASPFNYGSWQIQRLDGWTNGIIVEAYTEDLKRASFSNVDGHISCPGDDVLSATALTRKSYGLMSGTSMASPYCAAAFAALRALEPNLPLKNSIECFLDPPEKIEGATPRMDLKDAFEACRVTQP